MKAFNKEDIKSAYPLSPMQEGMFFHYLLEPQSPAYFEQMVYKIAGDLHLETLEKSFERLFERHDVFTTLFVYKNTEAPRQIVLKKLPHPFTFRDFSALVGEALAEAVAAFREDDRRQGFDLSREAPVRCALLKLPGNRYEIVVSFHHIIMDGWCTGILIEELGVLYEALKTGAPADLPAPVPYEAYIKWLRNKDLAQGVAFWKTYLDGLDQQTWVPAIRPRERRSGKRAQESFALPADLLTQLRAVAATHGVTLNVVFETLWGVLLHKYNNCHDAAFGAVVSGRDTRFPGIDRMIGLFINTVPVRVQAAPATPFRELLQRVQADALAARAFEYVPLVEVQVASPLRNALINHLLVFENYPVKTADADAAQGAGDFTLVGFDDFEQTTYDLTVMVIPADTLEVKIQYNPDVYHPKVIGNIRRHLLRIAGQVVADPGVAVGSIDILDARERERLLWAHNAPEVAFPIQPVHRLFEEKAGEFADAPAVTGPGGTFTYRQLNAQANRLARTLQQLGVGRGTAVGLLGHRSPRTVAAVMAVLKTGAHYVPIDPGSPAARVRYILDDCAIRVVLADQPPVQPLGEDVQTVDLGNPASYADNGADLGAPVKPTDLVYIIYTSGSTGVPKGVRIQHRSLVNTLYALQHRYPVAPGEAFLLKTPLTFDVSVAELFGWVIGGGRLVILPPGGEKDPGQITETIAREQVTHVNFVPSMFGEFVGALPEEAAGRLGSLRYVFLAGEAVQGAVVRQFAQRVPAASVVNLYGPTEAAIYATGFSFGAPAEVDAAPIGTALTNVRIAITSPGDDCRLVPEGVAGQLCIAGENVAEGYHRQPGLTAEKFIRTRLFGREETLYKTGDLARWLPDGNIEYLGRMDNQAKIRGYRVEPGETESQLLRIPGVKHAVVTVLGRENDKYLCAYYVTDVDLTPAAVKAYLQAALPDYLVPAFFVPLAELPVTANGKLDKAALPAPVPAEGAYQAPRDEDEAKLVELWAEILDLPSGAISVTADFFDLGGHSLKAIRAVVRIRKVFNREVHVADIFAHRTVAALAARLRQEPAGPAEETIPVLAPAPHYPLSFAQQRLWVLDQLDPEKNAANITFAYTIRGPLDLDLLADSFRKLVQRHEALRTVFTTSEGEPRQVILDEVPPVRIRYEDLTGGLQGLDQRIEEEARTGFDLGAWPLYHLSVYRTGPGACVLVLVIHHIVTDGWSLEVMIGEVLALYQSALAGKPAALPPLLLQYKDYAAWLNGKLAGGGLKKEETYWLSRLGDNPPVLEMPTRKTRPALKTYRSASRTLAFSEALTDRLNGYAKSQQASLYMVLFSLTKTLLYRYTGQTDFIIGVPTAGRVHRDLEAQIGFYVNLLPVRNTFDENASFDQLVDQAKANLLGAFAHQLYPFDYLASQLNLKNDPSRLPLVDVVVVLQNTDGKAPAAPEDLEAVSYPLAQPTSQFDLVFEFQEYNGTLSLNVVYNLDLFDAAFIIRLTGHYLRLAENALARDQAPVWQLDLLAPAEREALLGRPAAEPIRTGAAARTVAALFEAQVREHAGKTALVCRGIPVTYAELNGQANRLAHYLRAECGVAPNRLVGLLLPKSVDMIVAILAVVKAGGAYLPLDPDHPGDRIRYMLNESNVSLLLTSGEARPVPGFAGITARTDALEPDAYPSDNPEGINTPSDLLYVIYTSGTTGKPKGVLVEHRNLTQLIAADGHPFAFTAGDTWTLFHEYNFDFSVWEMYGALLYGGTLVIVPRAVAKDPAAFFELLHTGGVTVLNQTPTAFYGLAAYAVTETRRLPLRYVIFGGEALSPAKLKEWHGQYPHTELVNMFGITETTVHVTSKRITPEDIARGVSNIGKALPKLKTYVLDKHLNPVPKGIRGELYVAGEGVTRGYLNKPDLTAGRFIANPHRQGEVMYRSGDVGVVLENEEVEYLGRVDHQVNLHGYRIELGEIRLQLLNHGAVKDATVLVNVNEAGEQYLAAYLVAEAVLSVREVRQRISGFLPAYMMPAFFIQVPAIPLTANGKADLTRLRACKPAGVGTVKAPATRQEEQMAAIWQEVLQVEAVGVDSNYFELGGDSIKAIRLVSRINAAFGTRYSVADVYTHPTVEDLLGKKDAHAPGEWDALRTRTCQQVESFGREVMARYALSEEVVEAVYPMSDVQKGMFFYYLAAGPNASVYHDQITYPVLYQDFDMAAVRRAMVLMMEKHSILRTGFLVDELAQVVYRHVTPNMKYIDLSHLDTAGQERGIAAEMEDRRRKGFDIEKSPLWRMTFFNVGKHHVLLWEFHHAIIDGWSNASFLTEFNNVYLKLREVADFRPEPLRITYRDFIVGHLVESQRAEVKQYWQEELADYKRLPLLGSERGRTDYSKSSVFRRQMDLSFRTELEKTAARYNTSLKHLCFAAYVYMLYMLSEDNDVVAGLVTNNRPESEDGEQLLGCFLNTVPVRVQIPRHVTWEQYLRLVDRKLVELKKYDKLSLIQIMQAATIRTQEGNPVFDVHFNFINFHVFNDFRSDEAIVEEEEMVIPDHEISNELITLRINTIDQDFEFRLQYLDSVLDAERAARMYDYFYNTLSKFLTAGHEVAVKKDVLSLQEKVSLLEHCGGPAPAVPAATMHGLFARAAQARPGLPAVTGGGTTLTYRELNDRSDYLAGKIAAVQQGGVVALLHGRTPDLLVALLAILKSGNAYLPIDPDYPEKRIKYLLDDSEVSLAVSSSWLLPKLSGAAGEVAVLNLDTLDWAAVGAPATDGSPDQLAYVIYTSGSTGNPKGIMVEHRNVVNFTVGMQQALELAPEQTFLCLTTVSFDIFVLETVVPLTLGLHVLLATEDQQRSPTLLRALLAERRADVVQMTPSRFKQMMQEDPGLTYLEGVSRLVVGGEAFPGHLLDVLGRHFSGQVYNVYGPTETTVWSTLKPLAPGGAVTIGWPIANTTAYIISRDGQLQPPGVPGELCIGGAGVTRGYWKREALTRDKFTCLDIFGSERIYRTGDLARWLPDGELEFIGRADNQVKVRGFRIEPGEVEKAVNGLLGVDEAVVTARRDEVLGENQLCAYFTASETLDPDLLRKALAEQLPEYMVPSYFIQLDRIPLTPNNKVDAKALPAPSAVVLASPGGLPERDEEKVLADICAEIMGVKQICVDVSLFTYGLNSLNIMQILSRVKKHFGTELTLQQLFAAPTLEAIADAIRTAGWEPGAMESTFREDEIIF